MQSRKKCGANTRSGRPCRGDVVRGATRCRMHGGSSPQAKAKAKMRLVEADARAALAYEGITPIDDPIVELGRLAQEIRGMKQGLAARVAALDSPVFTDAFGSEQVHAEMRLYTDSIDRLVKALDLLGRHDLDARLVRAHEDTGRLFQYVIAGVLSELSLPSEEATLVPEIISKWLRLASSGVKANALPKA